MDEPPFFKFISDRYPNIYKTVKEFEIPEFKNVYLDMKSIIQKCSHPTDSDVHFRIGKREFTEQEIFENVTRYVELLFSIIKPHTVFFLAFDGVAPLAKINQQRSHRFKAAKDAKNSKNSILIDKHTEEATFDANCITPGTKFMENLIQYVKDFIAYKISTSNLWQKCQIIVSGPEVPGEAKHKIMEYLRYSRSQPNYDPHTSHCLYGMDPDLIILGLCSHEPHFSLLREEITFGKRYQIVTPEETEYRLVHLSLIRDYLEHEFSPLKEKLTFPFDIEKIMDDWILMGFFVGNDFIPHLPAMHIVKDGLPILYEAYMDVLPKLDGYINEVGTLRLDRLQQFINRLSCIELDHITAVCNQLKNYGKATTESECAHAIKSESMMTEPSGNLKSFQLEQIQLNDLNAVTHRKFKVKIHDSTKETCNTIQKYKSDYYEKKFKLFNINRKVIRTLAEEYLKAIQWNLNYYYNGCCSWSWYYPYHYSPYISDFGDIQEVNLEYQIGVPFSPLQHLMAVLPAASKNLLPKPLQFLMTDPSSPIIDYYPKDFETDLNKKTNDWEAVVLIPFIDEKLLLKAMEPSYIKLSYEERQRDHFGLTCIFKYSEKCLKPNSSLEIFPHYTNHAEMKRIKPDDLKVPKEKLIRGLSRGVELNLYFPGFPKLRFIEHTATLEKMKEKEEKQKKFSKINQPVEITRMVLNITQKQIPELKELASELLGKTVYAGWPHLFEAYVVAISDGNSKIILKNFWSEYDINNITQINSASRMHNKEWKKSLTDIKNQYCESIGINIGKTNVIIYAFPVIGRRYAFVNKGKPKVARVWSKISHPYAFQTIVRKVPVCNTPVIYKSITDIFKEKCICFMKGHPYYGAMGQITGVNLQSWRVIVALNVTKEPNFEQIDQGKSQSEIQYMPGNVGAEEIGISRTLLSRIMGSIFVTTSSEKRYNIGLNLKCSNQDKEVPGYTMKINKEWMYSKEALCIVKNYREKFPELFDYLSKNLDADMYFEDEICPSRASEYMTQVLSWLKTQESFEVVALDCNSNTLDISTILEVESIVDKFLSSVTKMSKMITVQVPPWHLHSSKFGTGNVPPDTKAEHILCDRIICIKENFTVPLGHKGTIVSIQERDRDDWNNMYAILFDSPFLGGLTLYRTTEHRCYRLPASDFMNISHGIRQSQAFHAENLKERKNKNAKAFKA